MTCPTNPDQLPPSHPYESPLEDADPDLDGAGRLPTYPSAGRPKGALHTVAGGDQIEHLQAVGRLGECWH